MNAPVQSRAGTTSWLPIDPGSDFSLGNLPFGVIARPEGRDCVAVAIGAWALDLAELQRAGLLPEALPAGVFDAATLNQFMALGRGAWRAVRSRVGALLAAGCDDLAGRHSVRDRALVAREAVAARLPVAVGDYIDFFSSLAHATNMGRILRPGTEPLPENWRRLPVGYHGRAATIVPTGTPIARPHGLRRDDRGVVDVGPSRRLDFELEVGFVVGTGNAIGTRIPTRAAADHIFGFVLVNDWSARDIQAFEYQPLGPFLGKSFATSISSWVVPLDALRSFLVAPPRQEPAVAPYLRTAEPWGIDLHLEAELRLHGGAATTVTRTNFASMYWTAAQQLAHATVNGAAMRTGDLCASGTVSGAEPGSFGSLMEASWGGTQPLDVGGGATRTFLEDGDEVVLRGWCGGDGRPRVGFDEVRGTIFPAPTLNG